MSGPLTLERLAEINSAISEYKVAKDALAAASKLVVLKDRQTIMVGKPHYDDRCYQEPIEVPGSAIRALIAARIDAAQQRLNAARRRLAQLNVETPA